MRIEYLSSARAETVSGIAEDISCRVKEIIDRVKSEGDKALRYYTELFDKTKPESFAIPENRIVGSIEKIDSELLEALKLSAENIKFFAEAQKQSICDFETGNIDGVVMGQRVLPVERAAIYVPGGNYPLVSSVLMGVIPAKVAGVKEVIVFTPPETNGEVCNELLAAGALSGADAIFSVGGAQAIAAAAWGTETIPPVDFIAGPGNIYVTEAKRQVFGGVGIDFIAGPSEIYIVADNSADPSVVAADMLAQAEHDSEAVAVCVVFSASYADQVKMEVYRQLEKLSTAGIASESLEKNGKILIAETIESAAEFINSCAPEHLELNIERPEQYSDLFTNYGSLFVGGYAGEVFGDYIAGINHTLPTAGAARYTGGLSVMNFLKVTTTLRMDRRAAAEFAGPSATIAECEGLKGHANAARLRSKSNAV